MKYSIKKLDKGYDVEFYLNGEKESDNRFFSTLEEVQNFLCETLTYWNHSGSPTMNGTVEV